MRHVLDWLFDLTGVEDGGESSLCPRGSVPGCLLPPRMTFRVRPGPMWIPEDAIQEEAWLRGLGIAFLELAALVAICCLGLVVFFFSKREIGIGLLCTFFFVCTGFLPSGVLLALVFGWLKAARW